MLLKIYSIWIGLTKHIGCRIITVDAKPTAVDFYKRFDFHEAIIDPRKLKDRETVPLYIDIHKELERLRTGAPLSDYDEARSP